jgi:polar amino acid transport system substrate-binding protein
MAELLWKCDQLRWTRASRWIVRQRNTLSALSYARAYTGGLAPTCNEFAMAHDLSRRHVVQAALLAGVGLGACSSTARLPSGAAGALAPTGKLRASINLGNPILARREGSDGAAGVSVDLARTLAEQLGVPIEMLVVDSARLSVDAVTTGRADVGFFAVDPQRANTIGFTAPYVLIEGAYLVRQGSPLTDNGEVDRAGHTIMVGRGSAYDLYLTRALKNAKLAHAPTSPVVVDHFLAQSVDVAAGVKQQLEADAKRIGGLRLLPGRFMVIEQAMGVPAARGTASLDALKAYVEWAKRSGFVAAALARHRIEGAVVAPPAS